MSESVLRFRFPESRSPRLLQILELAKAGQFTERTLTRGRLSVTVFQTFFDLTSPDLLQPSLSLATALLTYKGVEVWGNDQPLRLRQVVDVLKCYQLSLSPSDYTAHCWVPIGLETTVRSVGIEKAGHIFTFGEIPPADWIWPCRLAQRGAWQLRPEHPAPLRAQVQTWLAHEGCTWCPRLTDLSEWDRRQYDIRDLSR